MAQVDGIDVLGRFFYPTYAGTYQSVFCCFSGNRLSREHINICGRLFDEFYLIYASANNHLRLAAVNLVKSDNCAVRIIPFTQLQNILQVNINRKHRPYCSQLGICITI